MQGIDISSYQESKVMDGYDFVIIKASEGKNYKDEMLDAHYNYYSKRKDGKPVKGYYGFYHYARPDLGNTPEVEADSFLNYVGHHAGKAIFALDWEGESLNYGAEWPLKWLKIVRDKTGANPLFYTSSSHENSGKYNIIRDAGFPLWIADWSNTPTLSHWPDYAIWQFSGEYLDRDQTNPKLNWEALVKYSVSSNNSLKEKIIHKLNEVIQDVKGL